MSGDQDLRSIAERVAATIGDGPDPVERDEQRQRLRELVAEPRRGSWTRRWPLAAATLAVAAVMVWLVWPAAPMQFWIEDEIQPGVAGKWLRADAAPIDITFENGSRFAVTSGSRVQVVSVSRRHVRLRVAQGRVRASVTPSPNTTWEVEAGPFVVHVRGTVFDVEWDSVSEQLRVDVESGMVQVYGTGMSDRGVNVGARKSLQVSAVSGEAHLSNLEPETVEGSLPEPPTKQPTLDIKKRSLRARPPSWYVLAERGLYREAHAAAVEAGVHDRLNRLPLNKLWELGTAARYAESPLDVKILERVRAHFAASPQAATATFLLGRKALGDGRPGAAVDLLTDYLERAPDGPLAPEALGRLIDAHDRSGDAVSARTTARTYLQNYPRGTYRKLAEKIGRR